MSRGWWVGCWSTVAMCVAWIGLCTWVAYVVGDESTTLALTVSAAFVGWPLGKMTALMIEEYRHPVGGKR